MTLLVVIERGEDGYFTASCPSLKSCWSQGRTREEALANVREAIDLHLEPSPAELTGHASADGAPREVVALSL